MSFTRAELKYEIYERLNKQPDTRGFFTESKCNSAIQESIDYIAVEMMVMDNGWLKKVQYYDVTANLVTLQLPEDASMVAEVRALVGTAYIPLVYDSNWGGTEWAASSGMVMFPSRYRIVDNKIYFNPPIGQGQDAGIQITYQTYPQVVRADAQRLPPQFDRAMFWWLCYNSMTIMSQSMQQYSMPWQLTADKWEAKVLQIIDTRVQASMAIGNFDG